MHVCRNPASSQYCRHRVRESVASGVKKHVGKEITQAHEGQENRAQALPDHRQDGIAWCLQQLPAPNKDKTQWHGQICEIHPKLGLGAPQDLVGGYTQVASVDEDVQGLLLALCRFCVQRGQGLDGQP